MKNQIKKTDKKRNRDSVKNKIRNARKDKAARRRFFSNAA